MRRLLVTVLVVLAAFGGGLIASRLGTRPSGPKVADGPTVVNQMREVARLQTLELMVYKKISFEPDPLPAGSLWGEVANWARYAIRTPRGRAIVFADAELGLDLSRLGDGAVRVQGDQVEVVLPPIRSKVSLRPAETEFIDSNLDSAETAQLLELAKAAFERELERDPELHRRARQSAETALRALLLSLGFRRVHFVERLELSGT
jgi:hypothetical protein